jgi:stearoyl-CoA desaturase (delta-9 desaturase)
LTYGEGWHNNHHAFQTSARHGLDWWEVDPTYLTIKLLSLLGLAGNIKLPKISKSTRAVLAGSPNGVESQEELVDDPTQFVPSGV